MKRDVSEVWRKFPGRVSHRGGLVESLAPRTGRAVQEKILKGNNGNAALGLIILIAKHSYWSESEMKREHWRHGGHWKQKAIQERWHKGDVRRIKSWRQLTAKIMVFLHIKSNLPYQLSECLNQLSSSCSCFGTLLSFTCPLREIQQSL